MRISGLLVTSAKRKEFSSRARSSELATFSREAVARSRHASRFLASSRLLAARTMFSRTWNIFNEIFFLRENIFVCQQYLLDEGGPVVEGVLALLQQELDPGGEGSHHGGGGLQVPAVQRPGPRQPRQRTRDNVLRVLLADLKYFYMKIYFTTKYFFF